MSLCSNEDLATGFFICKLTCIHVCVCTLLARILTDNELDNLDMRPLHNLPRLFQLSAQIGVDMDVTLHRLCDL